MCSMSRARVVLITHPRAGAEAFARGLVERRLAACVNLLAARSIYRWEGAIQADDEALLVAKTDAARVAELVRHLASAHPYDVPECIALEPDEVEPRYLAWLLAETADEAGA
jgi:periplasmic divalent cation tolerance protein